MGAMQNNRGPQLVVDTSFGLTVGVVGRQPLHEADSRSHVEKIEPFIARSIEEAGLQPSDISTVIVGTGPAPFTGLRAGIVSAKAFAFATGAQILGQDVLEPQAWWVRENISSAPHQERIVLAVNDARRKQLYFQPFLISTSGVAALANMDIQYPQVIAEQVLTLAQRHPGIAVDVVGHGAEKYAQSWATLAEQDVEIGSVNDDSVLHADGARGMEIFAQTALQKQQAGEPTPTDPLYLRRPDVSIPAPLKPVLR